jgi:aminoglycoside N3'-acetyltransferase
MTIDSSDPHTQASFVHSDIIRVAQPRHRPQSQDQLLNYHLDKIFSLAANSGLIFPTFNYEFTRSKRFDPQSDPSQVGALSEFTRNQIGFLRSTIPVFSVSSNIPNFVSSLRKPWDSPPIDPFGSDSVFQRLREQKTLQIYYGANFSNGTTLIHHVERLHFESLFQAVPYRYDKLFIGHVTVPDAIHEVKLKYHVAPLGYPTKYRWDELELGIENLESWHEIERNIFSVDVSTLSAYFLDILKDDPFGLLDPAYAQEIREFIPEGHTSIRIEDFESPSGAPLF